MCIKSNKFIEKAKNKWGDKFDYSLVNFINYKTPIEIICPSHGIFSKIPDSFLTSKNGCNKCSGYGNINIDEFIKKSLYKFNNKYDYSLIQKEYLTTFEIIQIICPIHGITEQTPTSHLNSKYGCLKCSGLNSLTIEDFIEKSSELHNNKFDYSLVEYKNNRTKVKIICPNHGEFQQIPQSHLNGNGCEKCGLENTAKLATKTTKDFIEESNLVHKNKYDYSLTEYKKSNQKVKIICPIHGEFEQMGYGHLAGKGCNKCRYIKKEIDVFITEANTKHSNKFNYSLVEYNGDKKKVKIICSTHGEFEQTPRSHLSGSGCPTCTETKGEESIRIFLETNNINFEQEKKFDTLKDKSYLYYDFYLPKHNTCIEFDGKQHFEPIKYFGGEKTFLETIKRDNIKNQYCEDNNIKLLRISYKEKNKIETILSKFLC